MGKLASSLFLTLVRAPIPARGAPFTIHRHTIVEPSAGIAGRARRVRLPAIEGFRGLADCLALELGRKADRIAAPSKAVHLLRSSTET
jgi:hypothetical protein